MMNINKNELKEIAFEAIQAQLVAQLRDALDLLPSKIGSKHSRHIRDRGPGEEGKHPYVFLQKKDQDRPLHVSFQRIIVCTGSI